MFMYYIPRQSDRFDLVLAMELFALFSCALVHHPVVFSKGEEAS